ncbi:hypothetical protein [Okeania sp. KiyG1]|uniref:hypothetical protein n=1 Tax=Okeania sp. KiyG1 TaxID=2720165 RepID=UPI0019226E61|nr:hypothetical protein [Okeania sp. KiyG1]GGA56987.1 hypothetical protein CYANOKiyG1_77940 [Okeania sp. KiyG1]
MKYAESILLAGELIPADKADHNTYKELLCRCPECGHEVFLSREHERNYKSGKTAQIPNTWKHFKEVPELSASRCEARVGRYSYKSIQRKNSVARKQRVKFYQEKLFYIVLNHCLQEAGTSRQEFENHNKAIWSTPAHVSIATVVKSNLKENQLRLNLLVDNIIDSESFVNDNPNLFELYQKGLTSVVNVFIVKVAKEAIQYAITRLDKNLLNKLITICIARTNAILNLDLLVRVFNEEICSLEYEKNQLYISYDADYKDSVLKLLEELQILAAVNFCKMFLEISWIDELGIYKQRHSLSDVGFG